MKQIGLGVICLIVILLASCSNSNDDKNSELPPATSSEIVYYNNVIYDIRYYLISEHQDDATIVKLESSSNWLCLEYTCTTSFVFQDQEFEIIYYPRIDRYEVLYPIIDDLVSETAVIWYNPVDNTVEIHISIPMVTTIGQDYFDDICTMVDGKVHCSEVYFSQQTDFLNTFYSEIIK